MALAREPPANGEALLSRLYAGEIFQLGPWDEARDLAAWSQALLKGELRSANLREVHRALTNVELLSAMGSARRAIAGSADLKDASLRLLERLGLEPDTIWVDALRIRAVVPGAERVEDARSSFAVHRDVWYANPAAQINVWIPLFDVPSEQSIAFFPDAFARPVKNDSKRFDYDRFRSGGGFQNQAGEVDDSLRAFPAALDSSEWGEMIQPKTDRGQLLMFSAQQLHGARPNPSDRIRYSLELRFVDDRHHEAGLGARCVDNQSTGSALADYRRLSHTPHRASACDATE